MSKVSKSAAPATPGHSPATVAFAAKVVKLRDSGLSWEDVASKVGVPYGANGSSRLRRAYTIGGGATVGVRKNAQPKATPKAAKATAKKATPTPKATTAKPRTRGQRKAAGETATPAQRRAARQAAAAKA